MKIDSELLEKYNKPVPRYTSYPPANYFSDSFIEKHYRAALIESNAEQPANISIYIHIPFCNKLCFYCGCNSTPMAKQDKIAQYIEALKLELDIVLPKLDKSRKVSQIHYGGGTPNAIDSNYLIEINNIISERFEFASGHEIAIECHPAYLSENYIADLHKAGFNRMSLGIQDFHPKVLRNVNRDPSAMPLSDIIQQFKFEGSKRVNLDFIYGLPGQSVSSFKSTLEMAIKLDPDRLVTFSYAHVPWVNKAQLALEKKGLPHQDEKLKMFEMAYNFLIENGFCSIGMDHFVKPGDELYTSLENGLLHRNFQGYCTRETTGQVYAFGVSGISQLNAVYSQNVKDVDTYIKNLKEGKLPIIKGYKLSQEEKAIREAITQLMCNKTVTIENINKLNPIELKGLVNDGIIALTGNRISVTDNGMLFIRYVAALLDPNINSGQMAFSKSV